MTEPISADEIFPRHVANARKSLLAAETHLRNARASTQAPTLHVHADTLADMALVIYEMREKLAPLERRDSDG